MKAIVLSAVAVLLATPVFAALPSTHRPTQAALNAAFNIPVVIGGRAAGLALVPKGTLVTIAHVRHDRVQISFQGSVAWVKRSDTDFDQRLAVFRNTKQTAQAQVQQAQAAQNAAMQEAQA